MAQGKKSFLIYCDLIHSVEKMPDELAGKFMKHLLRYVNDLNPEPENLTLDLLFEPVKQQLKRDLVAYNERCDKNLLNGQKGGRPRKTEINQSVIFETQSNRSKAKKPDTDNDTDNDTDTDNEIKKRKVVIPPPPIFSDVLAYFKDNGYSEQAAKKAFDYYQTSVTETKPHWSDGKGNPIKNWKMKMQSVWFKEEHKEVKKTEQPRFTYTNPIL